MTAKQPALMGVKQRHFTSDEERERAAVSAVYKEARLSIFVKPSLSSLKRGDIFKGLLHRGSFCLPPVTCFVACGHSDKSGVFSDKNKEINIIDNLDAFIPPKDYAIFGKKDIIGLVTFQNGIANQISDFGNMGYSILSNLHTSTLCVGLYNPSIDPVTDVVTLGDDLLDFGDTPIICATRQMFTTFANRLSQINSQMRWLHIAHSKGCFIAKKALEGIDDYKLRNYLKDRLVIDTYGGVEPIPKSLVNESRNTYSVADKATWNRFGKPCLGVDGYDINAVKSMASNEKQDSIEGDHDFQGATYKSALKTNIERLTGRFGIYDPR